MNCCFLPSRVFMMAALALAALPFAHAKIERVVEKSFTVSEAGTVKIETSGGKINVEPSADATAVRVVATQRFETSSQSEADEIVQRLTLTIEQSGNDVGAKAAYNKPRGSFWRGIFGGNNRQNLRVDFTVTVPAAFAVVAKTSGGDLVIGDITGAVTATTSGGDVKLGRLGAQVDARTSGGDIELEDAVGNVSLKTSGGDIDARRIVGNAYVSTSGGDIEIKAMEGKLSAHTSGGDVKVTFTGALGGDCALSTSGGDVDAVLDKAAAFSLDARTSGGKVRSQGISLAENERRKNRLSGAANGGGPQLKLHSSGGDITVEGR